MSFNDMVSEIPSAVANIEFSITKIDEQILELNTQITDIKTNVLSVMSSGSSAYLISKTAALTISEGITMSLCTSGGYGLQTDYLHNITDWSITSAAGGPACDGIVYFTSSMLTSASSGTDLIQYNRQVGYDQTIDHIYREFNHLNPNPPPDDLETVTYGIQANIDGLQQGKDILEKDRDKLNEIYSVYSNYT